MKSTILFFYIISFVASLIAQPSSYPLSIPPPPSVQSGSTNLTGPSGSSTYSYYVIAVWPVGNAAPSPPITIFNAPLSLSMGNFITITWQPIQGVSSYTLLRYPGNTRPPLPITCSACLVASGIASNTYDNNSDTLTSYALNSAPSASVTLQMSNGPSSLPQLRIQSSTNQAIDVECITPVTGSVCGGLLSKTVTLSKNDIVALDTTPFVVIPAQGPGTVVFPFGVRWKLDFATTQYQNGGGAPYLWWENNLNPFGPINFTGSTTGGSLNFAQVAFTSAYFASGMNPNLPGAAVGLDPINYTNKPIVVQCITGTTLNAGPVISATPSSAGTGYSPGDIFTTTDFGPGEDAFFSVDTVDGSGGVATINILYPGMTQPAGTGISTQNIGNIVSSSLAAGGLGYSLGDTFTVDGGNGNASGVVDTIGAMGVVTAYHLTSTGQNYSSMMNNSTTATTGIGSGLTLDIVAGGGSGLMVDLTSRTGDGTVTITVWYTVAAE